MWRIRGTPRRQAGDVPGERDQAAAGRGPRAGPADAGLRAGHSARGQPRPRRGEEAGQRRQRARGHVLRAGVVRGRLLEGRGDQPSGCGQLHLARHLQAVARQDERRVGTKRAARRSRRGGRRSARRSAGGVRRQPQRAGPGGRNRSADRPRLADRARPARAGPAPEEQSAVRGGSGRRQDRHRRGPGPAHRARRGATGPGGRDHLCARHGGDGGRHALPRRLRRAVQGRHEGAAGQRERHRLHRRAAHHRGRGRRLGRGHGCLQPHQAGAGQRQASRHRHDDAQGIPQLHREGSGAGPAVPAHRGRGAVSRRNDPGALRPARQVRGVSRRHLHGQGAAHRRRAVVPVPQRSPLARQGHRSDR